MSTQMTVRIPDDLADFVDRAVTDGTARSRADLITSALRREMRRRAAVRDAEIYAAVPLSADDEALARWGTHNASRVWSDLDDLGVPDETGDGTPPA